MKRLNAVDDAKVDVGPNEVALNEALATVGQLTTEAVVRRGAGEAHVVAHELAQAVKRYARAVALVDELRSTLAESGATVGSRRVDQALLEVRSTLVDGVERLEVLDGYLTSAGVHVVDVVAVDAALATEDVERRVGVVVDELAALAG